MRIGLKEPFPAADETGAGMTEFDPGIIERYAADLHRKGSARVTRSLLVGAAAGAALGVLPIFHVVETAVPHRYLYAIALAAVAAGVYVGYMVGESRAVAVRLQAQLALHQLRIERLLVERATPAAAPAAEPEPVPPAVAAVPAPVGAPPDEPPVSAVS